jgi:hypothetical protein
VSVCKSTKLKIFQRDDYKCYLCKKQVELGLKGDLAATVDHVIPKCYGGSSNPSNLNTCCQKCNTKKSDKIYSKILTESQFKEFMNSGSKGLKKTQRQKKSKAKVLRRREALRKQVKKEFMEAALKRKADGKQIPIRKGEPPELQILRENAKKIAELQAEQDNYEELRKKRSQEDLLEGLNKTNQQVIDASLAAEVQNESN